MSVLSRLLGFLLCTTPFILGWLLFQFLNPTDFLSRFMTLLLVVIICCTEGIFAWIIGLSLLFTG